MSETKKSRKRVSKAVKQEVRVIRILNPFNPREFANEVVIWSAKKTLNDYFPLETSEVVISVNGKVIPKESFGSTYLDNSDNVVICPVPTGGGDNKQIFAIVAMIAIAVVAPYAAGALSSSLGLGLTAGSIGMGALTAGISLAGSLLVHALFAPSAATQNTNASSSTYGIDGAKNTSIEGIPVPVCYGEFRTGGNIISLHTENDGDTQTLYMLLSAGEGPVASISDVEINDNPITDYVNIETVVRLGAQDQTSMSWFNNTVTPQNKNAKLTVDYTYHTTVAKIDQFRMDLVAPSGLCRVSLTDGSSSVVTVPIDAEYRQVGSTAWQSLISGDEIKEWVPATADNSSNPDDASAAVANGNRVPVYENNISFSGSQRSAMRKSFTSPVLAPAKYEIRVRRTAPKSTETNVIDEVYLSDVNEIQNELLTYPNTAMLGVKVLLGDQISGLPKVTFINGGRIIQAYGKQSDNAIEGWYSVASKNPAWIVWDMLTNRRFGGGMNTNRLDFIAFKNWAAYCDDQALEWNGIIDSEMNVWDACQYVLRVGHAQLVNVGTRFTVVVEKAADPVMMFSVANIAAGTYKESWLGTADRANEIDVTFFDKTDSYKQRTVKVYDPASLVAGNKTRNSAITLYGVDNYETAFREGLFQLNLNRYILKTVSFSAPMEAVACTVGDLILVQNDMTDWAVAGRFDVGSTTSVVKLDRDVTMESGKQYKLLAIHDSVQRSSGIIQNIAGTSIFLTLFDGVQSVKRIQSNGRDLRIAGTFGQGNGAYGVIVDDATGLKVGDSYALFDTDVIEEFNVVNRANTGSTLTLQSPMSAAPQQYVNWMFGETSKVKSPFRIKSVAGGHDYHRDIVALQYDPQVYDFSRYSSVLAPPVPVEGSAIGACRNLEAYEETYVAGSNIVTKVTASWRIPEVGFYGGADIYVKKNDGKLEKVDSAKNGTSYTIGDVAKDDVLTIRIVAFDVFGKRSLYESAPQINYVVVGEIPKIKVGQVTGVNLYWAGRDCKLMWRYNATTASYEFGSEPTGADAGSLDPHFKDYEISVYDASHSTLRRKEYVTASNYIYTHDKNYADGLARRLIFEIRMRDTFNNVGHPATTEAYNPPPTVTSYNIVPSFDSAVVNYTHSDDIDFSGARVFLSEVAANLGGDPASDVQKPFLVYEGPDSSIVLPGLKFKNNYYLTIAPFDIFGLTELQPTSVIPFQTTNLNVAAIADGTLKASQLIPELQTTIKQVSGDSTVPNSVASQITKAISDEAAQRAADVLTEQQVRAAAIAQEQQDRVTAITQEAQTRSLAITQEAQTRLAAVSQETQSRIAAITQEQQDRAQAVLAEAQARGAAITQEATIRQSATDSLASQIATVTASTGQNAAAISTESTARTSADSALSNRIDTVTTSANNALAAISTESTTRASANTALSNQITSLSATVGQNTTAITSEATTRTTADSALSDRITSLTSTVGVNSAAITAEQTARANGDSALSNSITALTATVSGNSAAITAEQTARANGDSALSNSITALTATVGQNTAAITQESTTRSAGESALSSQINALTTNVNGNAANIIAEQSARATADTALSERILTLTSTVGVNSAAITAEQNARADGLGALSNSITGLTATVNRNTAAIASESTTRSSADSALSSQLSSLSTTVDHNTAAITAESTARSTADSALANSISALTTTVNGNTAAITSEATTRSTANTALTSRIDTLTTTVGQNTAAIVSEATTRSDANTAFADSLNVLKTTVGQNTAAITSESSARSSADSALSSRVDTLSATVGQNTASIISETTARVALDSSTASQLSALTTAYQYNDWVTLTSAKTYVQNYTYTRSDSDAALATAFNALNTAFQSGDAASVNTAQSYVQNYAYSKAASDSAIASQTTSLQTQYRDGDTATLSSAQSYVQSYSYSKSAADSAIATQINTVTSTLNGATTAIQQLSSSVNGLSGQYTVKIDNNGYVCGYGLASYTVNGQVVSEFIIRADTFGVVLPGYATVKPFVVGAVNGIPRVIISNALIGDASINTAQIGTLAVKSANIDDLTVGTNKITGDAVTEVDNFTSGVSNGTGFYVNFPSKVLIVANYAGAYTGDSSSGDFTFGVWNQFSSTVSLSSVGSYNGSITCSGFLYPGYYSIVLTPNSQVSVSITKCFILKVKK
ncbi:DUF1983 domain-containing protein [Undibacterium sp. 5I1]|uniref:phage tail protein n=2 Tax=Undibacterium TaxID=401469 RepID=UPI002AB400DC|nr:MULTISPECIES: phage tail protein [unclassified Undibacterium]MDY7537622.1 DUF1983 domain-containing protein [Undibacterium sp. 5I1]MEB0230167.1 DUF1983 domain-containing protein [Undibacterium sp. 10I3]MEB0256359.1 DUF1983 domain-containing protein [Undibacterium sp. 5I1]